MAEAVGEEPDEEMARVLDAVPGPCASCNHAPACGFASISDADGEKWYCHGDGHSCYEGVVVGTPVLAERWCR